MLCWEDIFHKGGFQMRIRLFFVSLIFSVAVLLAATPTWAAATPPCAPNTDSNPTKNKVCLGQPCTTHGSTTMDGNGENIIACLKDVSGSLVWKAMNGSDSRSGKIGPCYHVAADTSGGVFSLSGLPSGLTAQDIATAPNPWSIGHVNVTCKSGYERLDCLAYSSGSGANNYLRMHYTSNGCTASCPLYMPPEEGAMGGTTCQELPVALCCKTN